MKQVFLKNKPAFVVASLVFLLAFSLFYWWFSRPSLDLAEGKKQAKIFINGAEFSAGVALSSKEMYRGLSGTKAICDSCGLLFVFPDSQERVFVMRDMAYPLDIVFINHGQISNVLENLPPDPAGLSEGDRPLYRSQGKADRVLELAAGTAAKWGMKKGDEVSMIIYEY